MRITPCLTALFAAFLAGPLAAQVINIDFDETSTISVFQGLAAAPDPSGATAIWNRVPGSGTGTISAAGLTDSAGQVTSVGISVAINGGFLGLPGQQELGGAAGTYEDLMSDYIYLSASNPGQVVTKSGTISGLDPSKLYDIYLYGQGDHFLTEFSPGQNTLFTINSVSKQTSWDGFTGGNGLLVEGIEYVRFSVVSNASGEIDFSYANVVGPGDADGMNSLFAVINGIQIVTIPEPSVALLGGLGLLALLRRRR